MEKLDNLVAEHIADRLLQPERLEKILVSRMAEGVGFEPTLRFPVNTLSKRAPSATRPPLRTALPEGAPPPSGTSTSAEDGLFSRRCAIGPVRWGGTIVATIGLARHCRNHRVGSAGQVCGRRSPGYPHH